MIDRERQALVRDDDQRAKLNQLGIIHFPDKSITSQLSLQTHALEKLRLLYWWGGCGDDHHDVAIFELDDTTPTLDEIIAYLNLCGLNAQVHSRGIQVEVLDA